MKSKETAAINRNKPKMFKILLTKMEKTVNIKLKYVLHCRSFNVITVLHLYKRLS